MNTWRSISPRAERILFWFSVVLVAAACVARHVVAGLTMPVPWPDESAFLWQAIAVQRTNSLFAPELNALREVFWMPPGYMIAVGALFKITGASLVAARWFSMVC